MIVRIHPNASNDVTTIAASYATVSRELGQAFRLEVRQAIRYIRQVPEAWTIVNDPYRHFVLHRFPYVVVFRIDGKVVTVLTVFHSSRDPEDLARILGNSE